MSASGGLRSPYLLPGSSQTPTWASPLEPTGTSVPQTFVESKKILKLYSGLWAATSLRRGTTVNASQPRGDGVPFGTE